MVHPMVSERSDIATNTPSATRFVLLCVVLLTTAIGLEPYLEPLQRSTALLVAYLLTLLGHEPVINGVTITAGSFPVIIVTECTPLYPLLLFSAWVYATAASHRTRLIGLLGGAAVITTVNLVRIVAVILVGATHPALFETVHVYLGQVIMLLTVVGCCLVWSGGNEHAGATGSFLFRALCWGTILFTPWLLVHKLYLSGIDLVVRWIFTLADPRHLIATSLSQQVYNHAFALPWYGALLLASRDRLSTNRLLTFLITGITIIAAWHGLFRTTHILWSTLDIPALASVHTGVYLLGQLLVPLLLWLWAIRSPGPAAEPSSAGTQLMPPLAGLILAMALTSLPAGALAQTTITIQSTGAGMFHLRADGLNNVTTAEFNLGYHAGQPVTPRITAIGMGAAASLLLDQTTATSCTIRLAATRPLRGSGLLASIQLPDSWISYLSATLTTAQGESETPLIRIINPPDTQGLPDTGAPTRRAQPTREHPASTATEPPLAEDDSTTLPDAPSSPPGITAGTSLPLHRLEGPLDRFRRHTGPISPEILDALFAPPGSGEFSQSPPLAVADGITPVRITFRNLNQSAGFPHFIIRDGHVTGFTVTDDGAWILDMTPEAGQQASVTVVTATEMVEYPLTCLPPRDMTTTQFPDPLWTSFSTAATRWWQQSVPPKEHP